MNLRKVLWWAAFFAVGICLQRAIPGIDVLAAGLLVVLQERGGWRVFWAALALMLVQEGTGTLDFGAGLIWYPALIGFFFIGQWLFETRNMLFVFLLSACLGAAHFGVALLMARLQYIAADLPTLLDESILQAVVIPVVWKIASLTRRLVVPHENPA